VSRRQLSKEQHERIVKDWPKDLWQLEKEIPLLDPSWISAAMKKPDSAAPVAAVCLQDVKESILECRFALYEGLAHLIWLSAIIPNGRNLNKCRYK
jgi:hypothetical protein